MHVIADAHGGATDRSGAEGPARLRDLFQDTWAPFSRKGRDTPDCDDQGLYASLREDAHEARKRQETSALVRMLEAARSSAETELVRIEVERERLARQGNQVAEFRNRIVHALDALTA